MPVFPVHAKPKWHEQQAVPILLEIRIIMNLEYVMIDE